MKWYIETDRGCTIIDAPTYKQAKDKALRIVGTYGLFLVRKATALDIAWVGAMGGPK